MNSTKTKPEDFRGAGSLSAAPALDVEAAEEFRQNLLHCFASNPEVTLDLSSVERCDAAGLQVLLAAQKTALAEGKQFRVYGAPAAVTDTAASLGISLQGIGAG